MANPAHPHLFFSAGLEWRNDVVALVTDTGAQVEQVRYSAYGVPFGLPGGDTDSDGDVEGNDVTQIQTWITAEAYDVRGDLDLDGDVDDADKTAANNKVTTTLGWSASYSNSPPNCKLMPDLKMRAWWTA